MNEQLVETITKLVLEKIKNSREEGGQAADTSPSPEEESPLHRYGSVKVWNHIQPASDSFAVNRNRSPALSEPVVSEHAVSGGKPAVPSHASKSEAIQPQSGIVKPRHQELLLEMMSKTPARIGVGRAGLRPRTETWLRFRYDHAAAVDAVYGEANPKVLETHQLFSVQTMVRDKEEYILRPDLGRRLTEDAKKKIRERCAAAPKVQIVVSDGLSSQAIDRNFEDAFLSLQQSLRQLGIQQGTPFFVEKGRVAVMDEIGELLQPEVIVLFIGERPGLVSAESLSAYLCYKPHKGTLESDRMVISNIHAGGIPPVEAGAYLGNVVQKILKYKASGVALVQKEG
ncbi:ethanolamine ammonia-lyase subunit EutC [Aneurinibacillus terranovensis]|uniref:ethanolamine ammonia-lyase subunit EutC n=1 Tax=Aneurinibacillus terranovensis TaxID=278991 RepID=UPI0003F71F2B|nr:ethanolamine ammonia-lyase subunit EutC [Aneurinibacillus terranovensis]